MPTAAGERAPSLLQNARKLELHACWALSSTKENLTHEYLVLFNNISYTGADRSLQIRVNTVNDSKSFTSLEKKKKKVSSIRNRKVFFHT